MSHFTKNVENFTCEVCGTVVQGDGYTDHCPQCLWSKHIDVNPGDRAAVCRGLMEPIGLDKKHGEWKIDYKCQKCGYKHANVVAANDNPESLHNLSFFK